MLAEQAEEGLARIMLTRQAVALTGSLPAVRQAGSEGKAAFVAKNDFKKRLLGGQL